MGTPLPTLQPSVLESLTQGECRHVQGNPVPNSPRFYILFPFPRLHAELPFGMEQLDTQQRESYTLPAPLHRDVNSQLSLHDLLQWGHSWIFWDSGCLPRRIVTVLGLYCREETPWLQGLLLTKAFNWGWLTVQQFSPLPLCWETWRPTGRCGAWEVAESPATWSAGSRRRLYHTGLSLNI